MQALSGVGTFLKNNARTVIPGAATGVGFLSNWLAARRQHARDKFVQNLVQNPAEMQKYVSGFSKPLAAGLKENVGNQVQAFLGERGLSGSPSISADVESQALAPYQQQQQQMAINEALSTLGMMPQGGRTADLSGTLSLLMKGLSPNPGAPPHAGGPSNQDVGLTLPASGGAFDLDSLLGGFANG